MVRAPSKMEPGRYCGLTIAEWLTALVGVGSLGVAIATYVNAQDTRDIKAAIASLTELATQTKRQADNTTEQLAILRDQVGEAKKQTRQLGEQTVAIKSSADASVKSATAQMLAAETTRAANRPALALTSVGGVSAGGEAGTDNYVIGFHIGFSNTGGSSLVLGTNSLTAFVAPSLSEAIPRAMVSTSSGNHTVMRGNAHTYEVTITITPSQMAALNAGRSSLFVTGRLEYSSSIGPESPYCYAYRLMFSNGMPTGGFSDVGGPNYRCPR